MYRAGPRFNILFGGTVILARHFFRWGQRLRRFLRERCPEILRRISRRRVVSTQSAPFDSGVSSPPPDRKREEVKVNAAEPSTLLPGPSSDRRQCPHTRRERTQPLRRVRMRALVWARPTTMKDFIWHHDWLGHAAAQVAASFVCPINFLPSVGKRPNLPYEHSTPVIGPGRGRRPEALKLRKPPEEGR